MRLGKNAAILIGMLAAMALVGCAAHTSDIMAGPPATPPPVHSFYDVLMEGPPATPPPLRFGM